MLFSPKDLRRLVLPIVGEQILAVAVGMVDTVMVASVGETAVSGVALVDSITFLLLQVFSALCMGGAVIVSQLLGAQKHEYAAEAAGQLMQAVLAISLLLSCGCLLFYKPLLTGVFGQVEQAVMRQAQIYFFITACSFPFVAVCSGGSALLRCLGETALSLRISVVINVLNVAGNALLIYVLKMGVAGAAIASLFARGVAAVLLLGVLIFRPQPFSLRHRICKKPNLPLLKEILKIGIPSGLENGMFQVGKLLVQRMVASFGTAAIVANAVAGNIVCIATIPGGAVSLALLAITGKSIGAQRLDEARRYALTLMGATVAGMGVLNILVWCFLPQMLGIYHISAQAAQQTTLLVVAHCVVSTVLYAPSFCLPNVLRGAGDVSVPMIISICSMWICRIAGSYLLGQVLGLGVLGVWCATFIDWFFRSLLFGLRFIKGKWAQKGILKQQHKSTAL